MRRWRFRDGEEGNGKGRRIDNVRRIRAYFADFDDTPPPDAATVPLAPHAIIESSPGRWHWYWFIDGAPLDTFSSVQAAIAKRFGSDASMKDLPRVLRLPGFLHQKHEPFLTRIVELHDAPRYAHTDFVRAFGIDLSARVQPSRGNRPTVAPEASVTRLPTAQMHKRTLPASIPEGERNAKLLSLAAGLVRQGFDTQAVNDRLQRINAEHCTPPLGADEVDTIAARAIGYGSEGFAMLPHKLLDSPEWKALPPAAHDVILTAFRRYNGANADNIALTWADFQGREGFGQKGTFYRHRQRAVASGILRQARKGQNGQTGRKPDLFSIAPQWLLHSASVKKRTRPQCRKSTPGEFNSEVQHLTN
ncbi:MAG: DNA-primase RepB domain-containing protein [Rhodanobacteraceae bacterium]